MSGAVPAPPSTLVGVAGGVAERGPAGPVSILDELDAGRVRAAWPDPAAPGGWRVDDTVRAGVLELFGQRAEQRWEVGPFGFADRASTTALIVKDREAGTDARITLEEALR